MFKIFLASLQKADEKATKAMYTSDMDTEKESKQYRKYRAQKVLSSSCTEDEDQNANLTLPSPPRPPSLKCNYNYTNESCNLPTTVNFSFVFLISCYIFRQPKFSRKEPATYQKIWKYVFDTSQKLHSSRDWEQFKL